MIKIKQKIYNSILLKGAYAEYRAHAQYPAIMSRLVNQYIGSRHSGDLFRSENSGENLFPREFTTRSRGPYPVDIFPIYTGKVRGV